MPNFSTTFFNSTIEASNSFLALDDEEGIQDSICKPSHHCSPISAKKLFDASIVLLKNVVEKFGIPHFAHSHDKLLLFNSSYIY
jgi:hypothetical protein